MDTIKDLLKIFGIKENYLDFRPKKAQLATQTIGHQQLSSGRQQLNTGFRTPSLTKKTKTPQTETKNLPVDEKLSLSDIQLSFPRGAQAQAASYSMRDKTLTVVKKNGEALKFNGVPMSVVQAWERNALSVNSPRTVTGEVLGPLPTVQKSMQRADIIDVTPIKKYISNENQIKNADNFFLNSIQKNFQSQKLPTKDRTVALLSENINKKENTGVGMESFTVTLPESSTIQTAIYFPRRNYLRVSFKSGSTYSYDKVPNDVIKSWTQAKSAGSFFYYNIRTTFKYQKV